MYFKLLAYSLILTTLTSCFWKQKYRTPEEIKKSGYLKVLTRNSSTTFYKNKEGEYAGFEYELARLFANHLGVKLQMVNVPSIAAALTGVEQGRGDIAASSLTKTTARLKKLAASIPYNTIRQKLVCNANFEGTEFKDVIGKKLIVIEGSSYEERLNELKPLYPELNWSTVSDLSSDQALQLVWEGGPDCTVVDSNIVNVHRRFMPELKIIDNVSDKQHIVWYLHLINKPLLNVVNNWLEKEDTQAAIDRLATRYYGESDKSDLYKLKAFRNRVDTHLGKYKNLFKFAAKRYNLPWQLIAAISYQQSRWEEDAFEPRGGKGLMLVSKKYFETNGEGNIFDPGINVSLGVKHLHSLVEKIPNNVDKNEKIWLAVAAYNIGWAHIQDAQKIAVDLKYDPNTWEGIKKVLPLLAHKHYYKDLKNGFAQGVEPVIFVSRVKLFYNELLKTKGL